MYGILIVFLGTEGCERGDEGEGGPPGWSLPLISLGYTFSGAFFEVFAVAGTEKRKGGGEAYGILMERRMDIKMVNEAQREGGDSIQNPIWLQMNLRKHKNLRGSRVSYIVAY